MHCCTVPRNYYCLSICKLIFVTKTFYGVASNKGQELRICYGLPWKHIIVVQTFSLFTIGMDLCLPNGMSCSSVLSNMFMMENALSSGYCGVLYIT
jgi:hypothetical protein